MFLKVCPACPWLVILYEARVVSFSNWLYLGLSPRYESLAVCILYLQALLLAVCKRCGRCYHANLICPCSVLCFCSFVPFGNVVMSACRKNKLSVLLCAVESFDVL